MKLGYIIIGLLKQLWMVYKLIKIIKVGSVYFMILWGV